MKSKPEDSLFYLYDYVYKDVKEKTGKDLCFSYNDVVDYFYKKTNRKEKKCFVLFFKIKNFLKFKTPHLYNVLKKIIKFVWKKRS